MVVAYKRSNVHKLIVFTAYSSSFYVESRVQLQEDSERALKSTCPTDWVEADLVSKGNIMWVSSCCNNNKAFLLQSSNL